MTGCLQTVTRVLARKPACGRSFKRACTCACWHAFEGVSLCERALVVGLWVTPAGEYVPKRALSACVLLLDWFMRAAGL